MKTILPVENGDTLAALRGFLKQLLASKVVEAVYVPMVTPTGNVTPALVTNPDLLAYADPLAPVFPGNGATLVGRLSAKAPRPKVAAVLRACELRALVELTKMQQASLEHLTLIAIDCAGTFSAPAYQRLNASGSHNLWPQLFVDAAQNPTAPQAELRPACKICEQPVYTGADIQIHLFGSDPAQGIPVTLPDEVAAKLGLDAETDPAAGREAVVSALVNARVAARDAEFTAIRARLESPAGLAEIFATCIRCHNCMTVCPVCYCKTCVFRSAIFDHEPSQFLHWTEQKGALRLPTDTTLFHLTRLNHMGLSCVGCGMCTEACPAELPVGMVFRAIGQRLQEKFEYHPGHSAGEPLPLVTFKADEWNEVGE